MNEFINAYNKKYSEDKSLTDDQILERPFIGDPNNLSQYEKEELRYRSEYLHDTVEELARFYRVTPQALSSYLKENEITEIELTSQQDLAEFETSINSQYKQTRIALSGLLTLHTAKNWNTLAETELNLLIGLKRASEHISGQKYPNPKEISTLVNTHRKIMDGHAMYKYAVEVPAAKDMKNKIDALTRSLEDLMDQIDGDGYQLPGEETNGTSEA